MAARMSSAIVLSELPRVLTLSESGLKSHAAMQRRAIGGGTFRNRNIACSWRPTIKSTAANKSLPNAG